MLFLPRPRVLVHPYALSGFFNQVEITEEHWFWKGPRDSGQYGHFWYKSKNRLVHRLSYLWWVGPIPTGFHIHHLCKIRNCIFPGHLQSMSQADNNRLSPRRKYDNYCVKGHPLFGTNLRYAGNQRVCKICAAERNKQWRMRIQT